MYKNNYTNIRSYSKLINKVDEFQHFFRFYSRIHSIKIYHPKNKLTFV